jgi:hypothetical protein
LAAIDQTINGIVITLANTYDLAMNFGLMPYGGPHGGPFGQQPYGHPYNRWNNGWGKQRYNNGTWKVNVNDLQAIWVNTSNQATPQSLLPATAASVQGMPMGMGMGMNMGMGMPDSGTQSVGQQGGQSNTQYVPLEQFKELSEQFKKSQIEVERLSGLCEKLKESLLKIVTKIEDLKKEVRSNSSDIQEIRDKDRDKDRQKRDK